MALPMKVMKTAMKSSKTKAAMKTAMKSAMRSKAMKTKRVSKIAKGSRAKATVFAGRKEKTQGGLTKASLIKSKTGKIVSKKASAAGKKAYSRIAAWTKAVAAAKKALGISGFVPVGGKTAQGKALYAKAKSLYSA